MNLSRFLNHYRADLYVHRILTDKKYRYTGADWKIKWTVVIYSFATSNYVPFDELLLNRHICIGIKWAWILMRFTRLILHSKFISYWYLMLAMICETTAVILLTVMDTDQVYLRPAVYQSQAHLTRAGSTMENSINSSFVIDRLSIHQSEGGGDCRWRFDAVPINWYRKHGKSHFETLPLSQFNSSWMSKACF